MHERFFTIVDMSAPGSKFLEQAVREANDAINRVIHTCQACGEEPSRIEVCQAQGSVTNYGMSCPFCGHTWTVAVSFQTTGLRFAISSLEK